MNDKELEQRIEKANNKMLPDVTGQESSKPKDDNPAISMDTSNDLLQQQRKTWRNIKPREARGATPKAQVDMGFLKDSGIQLQYKKAHDDSDYYTSIGNKQYASMVKQQYMTDYFLPVVDAMVKLNGMEAVLANKELLGQLDALTLLDGTRGAGYTEAFVRSMYNPETPATGVVERSDRQVEQAVRDIKQLCEDDQIQTAVGKASDIKKHIDKGENIASAEDYEVIQKVALYGA